MTKEKWDAYAEAWSLPTDEREARLAQIAVSNVTYADRTTELEGIRTLSEYMLQFQENVPGGGFVIADVFTHHGQTLAHWQMLGGDGEVIMSGASHARLAEDGRFVSFAGFLPGSDGQS